jgi:hypothetical protein
MELGASPAGTVDATLAFNSTPISPDGPHVVADQEEYNFGSMERESTKSHVFVVRNEGRSPLVLKKGESTCRCTKFEIANGTLPPGEATSVTIDWHATVPPGPFRQSATIDTNDPARPQLTFTITGDVTSSHRVVPDSLAFSGISMNEPHTAEVNIFSYRPGQLEVVGHEFTEASTADKFEFRAEPMPAKAVQEEKDAQSGVVLHVTVKPGLPLGAFKQKIVVRLNQTSDPVEVPIEGNTVSDVVVAGRNWDDDKSLLSFGTVSGRDGAKAELFILAHGPHAKQLRPTVKQLTPNVLKITVGQPAAGADGSSVRVPLTVEIPAGTPAMLHLGGEEGKIGEILIDTNDPEAETIRIRVRFAVGE